MKIKNILVPVDFQPCSLNALKYAAMMAKRTGATVTVAHAIQVPLIPVEVGVPSIAFEVMEGVELGVNERFKNLEKKVPELKDIAYKTDSQHSLTTDGVISMSEKNQADLIVMGTKGAKGFFEALIGSNTLSVVKHAKLPVLIVPENAEINKPSNIALASDYKRIGGVAQLDPLITLAQAFAAKIKVLHVKPTDRLIDKKELEEAKSLERYFRKVDHSYHHIVSDQMDKAIRDYNKNQKIDLLTLIPREHSFIDQITGVSWTKKFAYNSDIPLLILQ